MSETSYVNYSIRILYTVLSLIRTKYSDYRISCDDQLRVLMIQHSSADLMSGIYAG